MLLPNWGMRVTAVETTQEALDRLRAAATQGPPWTYSAGRRRPARHAQHRAGPASEHRPAFDVRRGPGGVSVWRRRHTCRTPRSVTLISRQAPDPDLRAALTRKTGRARARAARHPPSAATTAGIALRRARVLLVEDNPVNLMVGQRLLSVLGVDRDTANNGEAALLRMSAWRYDLVLMDCQMPVIDGYTATRRWREGEACRERVNHLPIIAMTANAMAGDRQKCLDAGMDDYLAKPVTRAELERCLHRGAPAATPFDARTVAPRHPPAAVASPRAAGDRCRRQPPDLPRHRAQATRRR